MKYYYIHPFKPQYFFPKAFKKHEVFISFFKPYSRIGKVSWWLFRTSELYRKWFGKSDIESFIPENEIRKIIGIEPVMAFNTGTPGIEQKITGLGWDNNEYFFIKYAHTPLAIKNVVNEYYVLNKIKLLDFVPQIKSFHKGISHVLLKTDILTGERLPNISINESILNCLFKISEIPIASTSQINSMIEISFAHGDFCPWNMMKKNGKILVFDWEMAGKYPLGYDLFTYVFQANFLLKPEKSIQSILSENKEIIDQYFNHFKISAWNVYLIAFSKAKVALEKKKGLKGMLSQYKILLDYAEKA